MSETEHIKRTLRGMVQSAAGASVLLPGAVTAPDVTSALPWAGVGLVVSGLLAHAMDRPGTQFLLPNWLRISPSRRQPRAGPERDEQTVPARRDAPEHRSEHVHLAPQRSQPVERSAEQPTEQPEPSVRLVHIGPGPDGPTFAPNEPPPSDPAAELQRLRAAAEVGFARADGALALLEQRSHRTEEQLREHDQRLEALERNRWPLHVIEVLVAIGVMILTFWQLLADVSRPRPHSALLPGGGGGVRGWVATAELNPA